MNIQEILEEIRTRLRYTFSQIDQWFEKPLQVRSYKPLDGGWSINEILEHIALTNHFLLILIDKGTNKALQNAAKLSLVDELESQQFHYERLNQVGLHGSFEWIRPEHMEPKGVKTQEEVRNELRQQLDRCLANLDRMPNGEGVLYKTTMSVNELGKINVYEYIYFLAQHGLRHLTQMEKVEKEGYGSTV